MMPVLLLFLHVAVIAGGFSTFTIIASHLEARRLAKLAPSPLAAFAESNFHILAPGVILFSFLITFLLIAQLQPLVCADHELPPLSASGTIHGAIMSAYATLMVISACNFFLRTFHKVFACPTACELAIELMVIIIYLQMSTSAAPVVFKTVFSRYFFPSRLNLWSHSTVAQLLIFSSSPRVAATFTWKQLISKFVLVVAMFYLGGIMLVPPPQSWAMWLRVTYTASLILPFASMFFHVLRFVDRLLLVSLNLPEEAQPMPRTKVFLKLLHPTILLSWVAFPLVFIIASCNLMSFDQESFAFAVCDLLAKSLSSVVLHSGIFASLEADEHVQQMIALREREITVRALKTFAQSLGHDLRTPMQALVLSVEHAQREVKHLPVAALASHTAEPHCSLSELKSLPGSNGDSDAVADGMSARRADLLHERIVSPPGTPLGSSVSRDEASASTASEPSRVAEHHINSVQQRLREVEASVELLSCIIGNVWDFEQNAHVEARPDSGDVALVAVGSEEDIDINALVCRVVEVLKLSSVRKSSVFVQVLPDSLIPNPLRGDSSRLVRIILNLLVNAMKFTDHGHISLRTTCLSSSASPTIRVRLDVVDTGRGMTEQEAALCTTSYVRCDKRKGGGLGLGLAIVSKAVRAMGGTFNVHSSPGVGTLFTVDLEFKRSPALSQQGASMPRDSAASSSIVHDGNRLAQTASEAQHTTSATLGTLPPPGDQADHSKRHISTSVPDAPGPSPTSDARSTNGFETVNPPTPQDGPKRVMLVDDVEMIRDVCTSMLSCMGHVVLYSVDDGPAALQHMLSACDELDAVFMDVQLLTMDGHEVTRLYRQWERKHRQGAPPLLVYGCTGNASEVSALLDCGFSGVATKPLTPAKYAAMLSGDPDRMSSALVNLAPS